MPVQIGQKSHNFSDPTGLLSDCHRRIEMFLGSLEAVSNAVNRPPDEDTRRTLDTALRYFREAAPKHTADEEQSLFPRLRHINTPEVQRALLSLDELESDHRWAEPLHQELEDLGTKYLGGAELSAAEVERFRKAVIDLKAMYERHIAVEDGMLFPAASQALSSKQKQAIAQEMAARRSVKLLHIG
jgi:hemerythrin-like domain-containing protein